MIAQWAKMPSSWIIQDHGLRDFSIKESGTNAQALKLYITIALMANFKPNKEFSNAGCAAISYSEFEEIAGGSRTLIANGIRMLESYGLIERNSSPKTHVYRLQHYADRGYAQLPKRHILQSEHGSRIAQLSLRNVMTLNALKLYLLLAAFRDTRLNKALISYDKIEDYTKIRRRDIRPAISTLIEYRLIDRRGPDRGAETFEEEASLSNEYTIIGLGPSRSTSSPQPADKKEKLQEQLEAEL
jgi:hypothetical protein